MTKFNYQQGEIKVTFTRGYGKFKKKFCKIYKRCEIEQMKADIDRYSETGWRNYIWSAFPLNTTGGQQ